ncbi:YbaB/EbfC family nucleoid-associated protein [Legionella dresdenensis]|uniref:Nucleoid-associated protein ACFORL_06340 n=1 Tax=Legionella dresdenensis TaxID=450200 RepID=A0ABV8CEE6_9GAMM
MDLDQNLGNIMKEAQKLQERMMEAQNEISKISAIGEAGGGMVKIHILGNNVISKIDIHPSLMEEEVTLLCDLLIAAYNSAREKIEKATKDRINKLTSGFNLPDFMKDQKE